MKSGIAIQNMVKGLLKMISPLNEKSNTRVTSNAIMLTGVRK